MSRPFCIRSMSFTRYVLLLCGIYVSMVYVFHNHLEYTKDNGTTKNEQLTRMIPFLNTSVGDLKNFVNRYKNVKDLARKISTLEKKVDQIKGELILERRGRKFQEQLVQSNISDVGKQRVTPVNEEIVQNSNCFKRANDVAGSQFHEIEENVFVFSTYLDKRKSDHYLRMIVLVASQKKKKFALFCHFGKDQISHLAVVYEMCENHNKPYGGYIYSCKVKTDDLCPFSVSTSTRQKKIPLSIIKWSENEPTYDFGICIPPLFGKLKQELLVEFVELSKLLGAQYFFIYDHDISPEMLTVLKYYESKNITSIIPWNLPKAVTDKSIWYHGQLLAHNDCLYRSMDMLSFLAINDVDEFIVPRTLSKTWQEVLPPLLQDHCGFSFPSAFFDPNVKGDSESDLLTLRQTIRSPLSAVRKKVMIAPKRVFEVGIHHISKQNEEKWTPLDIPSNIAFLHHYRKCIGNYGMKCQKTEQDPTIPNKYSTVLINSFNKAMEELKEFTYLNNLTIAARYLK